MLKAGQTVALTEITRLLSEIMEPALSCFGRAKLQAIAQTGLTFATSKLRTVSATTQSARSSKDHGTSSDDDFARVRGYCETSRLCDAKSRCSAGR